MALLVLVGAVVAFATGHLVVGAVLVVSSAVYAYLGWVGGRRG